MKSLEEQVLDTWTTNHKVNLLLMDQLEDEHLDLTLSKRGGGKIGHQLAHLYNIRFWTAERISKPSVAHLNTITSEDVKTLAMLRAAHTDSYTFMHALMAQGLSIGKIKGHKPGPAHFVSYMIAHESHHRGNMLLVLKQSGIKLNKALKYGIWGWTTL